MRILRRSNSYAAETRIVRNPCVIMTGMGLALAAPAMPFKPLPLGSASFAPGPQHAYAPQLRPAPQTQRSRRERRAHGMHGLGIAVAKSTDTLAPIISSVTFSASQNAFGGRPISSPPPGVVTRIGPVISPLQPVSAGTTPTAPTTPTTSAGAGAAGTAGTPVPANYPTDQFYVTPSGAVWEYSAAQGAWINVGTPYNVGASAASAPASGSSSAPTTVTQALATGNSIVASDGSVWQYSSASGTWVEISGPNSATPAAGAPPASYFTSANAATSAITPATVGSSTVVASDGSVWQYNASTGTWAQTEAAGSATPAANAPTPAQLSAAAGTTSDYQAVLNWLTESTLISGVPNWVMALGIGIGAKLLFDHASQGRSR